MKKKTLSEMISEVGLTIDELERFSGTIARTLHNWNKAKQKTLLCVMIGAAVLKEMDKTNGNADKTGNNGKNRAQFPFISEKTFFELYGNGHADSSHD